MADEAPKEPTKNNVVLKLVKLPFLDKDGKEVAENGEVMYKHEDVSGLFTLINRYDSTKHPGAMKGFRAMISIKDKLETVMLKQGNELMLNLEEAHWLKNYLEQVPNNEAAQTKLGQFEIRTLTAILDQLQ